MIGTNDLGQGLTPQHVADNVAAIVSIVKASSPCTRLFIQSILPSEVGLRTLSDEQTANAMLRHVADTSDVTYIDLWQLLSGIPYDTTISLDGLHLTAKGYRIWCQALAPYIGSDVHGLVDGQESTPASLAGSQAMRATYFAHHPIQEGDILFFGDEMVKCGEWSELLPDYHIRNRGTGWGYDGSGPSIALTSAMVEAQASRPASELLRTNKILLYTATGDVNGVADLSDVQARYSSLLALLSSMGGPRTDAVDIYLLSLMPTCQHNERVVQFNAFLQQLARTHDKLHYIDIYSDLVCDSVADSAYIVDNYLYGNGYRLVAQRIREALSLPYNHDYTTLFRLQQHRTASMNKHWLAVSNSFVLSPFPAVGHYLYSLTLRNSAPSSAATVKADAAELGASWLLTAGSTMAVKMIVGRSRPYKRYRGDLCCLQPVFDPSFPSGHTSFCFSAATSLSLIYPKWYVVIPAYLWAGAVGYSRMYVGAHYPTDVVTGAILGTSCAVLAHVVRQRIANRQPQLTPIVPTIMLPLTLSF